MKIAERLKKAWERAKIENIPHNYTKSQLDYRRSYRPKTFTRVVIDHYQARYLYAATIYKPSA